MVVKQTFRPVANFGHQALVQDMKGTQQSSCSRQTYKSQKCTNIRRAHQAQAAGVGVDPKNSIKTGSKFIKFFYQSYYFDEKTKKENNKYYFFFWGGLKNHEFPGFSLCCSKKPVVGSSKFMNYYVQVGFTYTFLYSLLSTSSTLEQCPQFVHLHHFKICLLWFLHEKECSFYTNPFCCTEMR